MMSENTIPTSSWRLGYNFTLLLKQLSKGWLPTLMIVVIMVGLNTYYLQKSFGLKPFEIAVAIVGILSALAFLKAALLYMGYKIFNKTTFNGSFFITSLFISLLLIVALGALSFLVSSRTHDFPKEELIWLFPAVYGIMSVFLFITFRVTYWVFNR